MKSKIKNQKSKIATLLCSLFFAFAIPKTGEAAEQIIYQTGFESSESFTATTTYNAADPLIQGPAGKQWAIFRGSTSTTSPLVGLQGVLMRWYTAAPTLFSNAITNFDLPNVTKVTFRANTGRANWNITASYSTDGGNTWVGDQLFTLATTTTVETTSFTYNISATGEFANVRIRFAVTSSTTHTANVDVKLDDVVVYGMVTSSNNPTITTDLAQNEINFGNVTTGSATETVVITGSNLTALIICEITGTDAALFTLDPTDGELLAIGGSLDVTFTPVAQGVFEAFLTCTSTGASPVVIELIGANQTPLGVPTATSATNIGAASFVANWTEVAGVDGYRVNVMQGGTAIAGSPFTFNAGTTTSGKITGLTPTTTYSYTVQAFDEFQTSVASNEITGVTTIAFPNQGDVIISQINTAGTAAGTTSANARWMELFNTTNQDIILDGLFIWNLNQDIATTGASVNQAFPLTGTIPARGFFLIARNAATAMSPIVQDMAIEGVVSAQAAGKLALATQATGTLIANYHDLPWILDLVAYGANVAPASINTTQPVVFVANNSFLRIFENCNFKWRKNGVSGDFELSSSRTPRNTSSAPIPAPVAVVSTVGVTNGEITLPNARANDVNNITSAEFKLSIACLTGNLTLATDNSVFTVLPLSIDQSVFGEVTVTVSFAPTAVDNFTGILTVSGSGITPITINLSGAGVSADAAILEFTDRTPLDFSNVLENTTSTSQPKTIFAANLEGNTIAYTFASSGTNTSANFAFAQDAAFDPAAGGIINVTFTPQAPGLVVDTLIISTTVNSVELVDSIAMSGTGIALLGTPVAMAATNVGRVSFTANWDALDGATGYELVVEQAGVQITGSPFTVTGTSRVITGLTPETVYTYSVRATGVAQPMTNFSNVITATTIAWPGQEDIIITAVYGGAGSGTATFNRRYVELFNNTTADIALTDLFVLYGANSTATLANPTTLSGVIKAGSFYLLTGDPTANGANLPITGDGFLFASLSATQGKVALSTRNSETVTTSYHTSPTVIDFVAYGTNGTPAGISVTPAPSATAAVVRQMTNCQFRWTENSVANAFATQTPPAPRNAAFGAYVPVATATTNLETPNELTFLESVREGESGTATFVLTPACLNGNLTLSLTTGTLFSVSPTSIAQTIFGDTNITITFTPPVGTTGNFSDVLTISGSGITPIVININAVAISATQPGIIANPHALSFGSVLVGQSSLPREVKIIQEYTTDVITYSDLTGTGFSVDNSKLVSDSVLIVTFTPTAATTFSQKLYVYSVADGLVDSVTLTGTGLAPLAAPVATAATNPTYTGFTANWNKVAGATSYVLNVYQGTDTLTINVNADTNMWNVLRLIPATTYTYTVSARDAVQTSAESNPITVITNTAPNQGDIIITQVYAAGGNANATFRQRWIELFNTTESDIVLDGLYLSYVGENSNIFSSSNQLLSGTIKARSFFLLDTVTNAANGADNGIVRDARLMFTPAAAAGKIGLSTESGGTILPLYHNNPRVIDLVAYGVNSQPAGIDVTGANTSVTLAVKRIFTCDFKWRLNGVSGDFLTVIPSAEPLPRNAAFGRLNKVPTVTTVTTALELPKAIANLNSTTARFTLSTGCLTGNLTLATDNSVFTVYPTTINQSVVGDTTITVTFTPTAVNTFTGILTISGSSITPITINLTGEGDDASATMLEFTDDTPINFSNVIVGATSVSQPATVFANNLQGATIGFRFASTGTNTSTNFAFTQDVAFNPATGGNVNIVFTPKATDMLRDTLIITATVNSVVFTDRLPLSGTGVVTTLGATPNPVNAGQVEIGKTKNTTVNVSAIHLTGNVTLALTGDAAFSIDSTTFVKPADGTLSNKPVVVTYAPTAIATHTATLTISSPGADNVVVNITGEGIAVIPLPNLLITAVHAGAGNSGATWNQKFIELFNTTNEDIDLGGIFLGYENAAGSATSKVHNALSGTIRAKSFFLIGAQVGSNGVALPVTPDLIFSSFNPAAAQGKLWLTTINPDTVQVLYNNRPTIIDLVAYGGSSGMTPTDISVTGTNGTSTNVINRIFDGQTPRWHANIVNGDFQTTATSAYTPRNSNVTFAPTIRASEAIVDFVRVDVGDADTFDLVVTGLNLETAIAIAITGDNVFSIVDNVASLPAVGGTLGIQFAPTAVQTYNATLTLTNAAAQNVVVTLKGIGVLEGTPILEFQFTADTVKFATTVSGTTSASQSLTVNGENLTETITGRLVSATKVDDFYIEMVDGWNPLTGGTFNVIFTPKTVGPKTALLIIESGTMADTLVLTGSTEVEVANIAEFKALATNTIAVITGNVTFVYRNNRNMYIKDATGGLAIYDDATSVITTTYNNGDVISGGVLGRKSVNATMNQMIPLKNTAAGTAGTPVQPISVTMANLLANFAIYEAQLVKLEDVFFTADGAFGTGAAGNLAITQDGSNMLARNHFNTFTNLAVTAGIEYDITGFIIPFNTDRQIAPRSSSDIVKYGGNEPSLTVNFKSIEFGSIRVDESSIPEIATVTGVNLVNVIIGEFFGDDEDFFAIQNDGWNPITGGTISITFEPQTVGQKTAILYIRCAETNVYDSIILTGTAIPPVSICPREFENSVVFYPNPVQDMLYVQAEQVIAMITVHGMTGQIVAQQIGNKNSVDVSRLPHGTYVVRVLFDNGTILSRLIVK